MTSRPYARTISVVVIGALAGLGANCTPTAPTRAECPTHARCQIVQDADFDGEIADDLRVARNTLLYDSNSTAADTVYLYPPDPGDFTWTGEVRFCGDDSFLASPPGDDSEPDCDGKTDIPKIAFLGAWDSIFIGADCNDGDTTVGVISSCLRIGDRYDGDAGAAEPLARVTTSATPMKFTHVQTVSIPQEELVHPIYAVWLDGVRNSTVGFEVTRDRPGALHATGSGVYVSATNSTVAVGLAPGAQHNLVNGVIADGMMDGTVIHVDSDSTGAVGGLGAATFGTGTGSAIGMVSGLDDACDYGPDIVATCRNLTAHVTMRTPLNNIGFDAVVLIEGDEIVLDLDMEYLTVDHYPLVLGASILGDVHDVTIQGQLDFGSATLEAIKLAGTTDALLDVAVHNDFAPAPTCFTLAGSATVQLGPNYQCTGSGN